MTTKTLGILGGGQLGMFSAAAAEKIGIQTIIYSDTPNPPAAKTAGKTIVAAYDDETALKDFAEQCDVITYEFENIPVGTVRFLQTIKPVYPDDKLLDVAQDRIAEKTFLNQIGIETASWMAVNSAQDIAKAFTELNAETLIFKTTRFGYDGKGQAKVHKGDNYDAVWNDLGQTTLIAESLIDFDHEISVIVARDQDEKTMTYGPMLNVHKNHILHETIYPSGLNDTIQDHAKTMAVTLANEVNLCGVLCLELFVTKDGTLLANEIAPRTHNSGHWSIDACQYSQFDNHVRAVCGLPVLDPKPRPARMVNLIGNDISNLEPFKDGIVHDYGKGSIKPGRKMGHVTFLED